MSVEHVSLTREEVLKWIEVARGKLGNDPIILAHLYHHDDVVRRADFIGDSLKPADSGPAKYAGVALDRMLEIS